jgi:hypothetical protein
MRGVYWDVKVWARRAFKLPVHVDWTTAWTNNGHESDLMTIPNGQSYITVPGNGFLKYNCGCGDEPGSSEG